MLFNSIDFAIFLPIVFTVYWLVGKWSLRMQNLVILASSLVFYGWWDWRFLSLILASSFLDYVVGLRLKNCDRPQTRRYFLLVSIVGNLGMLGFFKYFNFFARSFADAFTLFGTPFHAPQLGIILPVGISFYTFQTMSYTIDVYRRELEPTSDIVAFFSFVSFFPQLVAGPIERASNLLPQFYVRRHFDSDKARDGVRQIIWGLFKKMVIADNCAIYANMAFNSTADQTGSGLWIGVVLFAFQIYADFSGYSDIAIGTARLFGFNLMRNFAYPYFSRDIAEFWRRWHISLSTWFRDYVYIPLGGSKGNLSRRVRNTMIIFAVSGFWHGANWTFLAWGVLNALYFLPLLMMSRNRKHTDVPAQNRLFATPLEMLQIVTTFILTLVAWVFFRAESMAHAFTYLSGMFSSTILSPPTVAPYGLLVIVAVFTGIEWLQRHKQHALQVDTRHPVYYNVNRFLVAATCWAIFIWAQTGYKEFIYFQF